MLFFLWSPEDAGTPYNLAECKCTARKDYRSTNERASMGREAATRLRESLRIVRTTAKAGVPYQDSGPYSVGQIQDLAYGLRRTPLS